MNEFGGDTLSTFLPCCMFISDSQTRKFITLSKEAIAQQEKELKAAYQKMFKQTDKT